MPPATYIVVYAHPHVDPRNRVLVVTVDSDARGKAILDKLYDAYPDFRHDLKSATLWKASRLTGSQIPLLPGPQTSELATVDVRQSNWKVYQWIKERGGHPEHEIDTPHLLGDHFPNRSKPPSGYLIEIVAVTNESACSPVYSGPF